MHCLHHYPLDGRLTIPRRLSPVPWVLGHVCSRWRKIALGERRLWNSIYYEGKSRRHVLFLKEAFKYSGQSTLQLELETRESGEKLNKAFFREVICPQSHRITSLSLGVVPATFRVFLLLPSGLFDELECIKLQILWDRVSMSMPPATVFQAAPRLRRVTIPLYYHSPLDLALPWGQLTYLALTGDVELTDSFEVLSLCTNLWECHICPSADSGPPIPVFHPASIQLPHLRTLRLNMMAWEFSYADFFRPLVFPKLEQFTVVLSSSLEGHLNDIRETIDHLSNSGLAFGTPLRREPKR